MGKPAKIQMGRDKPWCQSCTNDCDPDSGQRVCQEPPEDKSCLTCKHGVWELTPKGKRNKVRPGRCSYEVVTPDVPHFLEERMRLATLVAGWGIWPEEGKNCKCWERKSTLNAGAQA